VSLADRLRAALAAGVAGAPEPLTGDLTALELESAPPFAAAAVLVAVTDRAEPGVILTQRTETLRKHPGQVAFPGGRIDPGDGGAVGAALREAWEEIGLSPEAVEVIGAIDRYHTGTGFDVTPVLGVVAPDLRYVRQEAEVADVFEVPLAFLLDPANHKPGEAMWKGRVRHYHQIDWQGRHIWGATAAMVVNLSRRLTWPA
jgi:8-oxo-dGTP pyrophosphatase MutT (NUDIX family)